MHLHPLPSSKKQKNKKKQNNKNQELPPVEPALPPLGSHFLEHWRVEDDLITADPAAIPQALELLVR